MRERVGDRVAHLNVRKLLDAPHQVAHLAGTHFVQFGHLGIEDTHLVHAMLAARGHEVDGLAGLDAPIHDADEAHHAAVGVVVTVEDQGLERRVGIALGWGNALDDLLEHLVTVLARLCTHFHGVGDVHQPDDRLDLLEHAFRFRGRQVGLVENREDFQIVLQGQIGVREGLGLHTLGGIHDEDGAFAGGQAAAHLVGEIHVSWRVNEVQRVGLPILGIVFQGHRVGLDGDAPFPFEFHIVQDLGLHLPLGDRIGQLQQAIR